MSQAVVKRGNLSDVKAASLNKWFSKWKDVKSEGQKTLTEDAAKQVKNLIQHINKGCLSNIPPSCETNKNERMHEYLNRCGLAVRRIGPELAVAWLEIHIFKWNQNQGIRQNSQVQIKQPDEVKIDKIMDSLNDNSTSLTDNQPYLGVWDDIVPQTPSTSSGTTELPAVLLQLLLGISTAANMVQDVKKKGKLASFKALYYVPSDASFKALYYVPSDRTRNYADK